MIVHNIIDVSPLYHRFAYRMANGGNSEIPIMYIVMREIERMRIEVESRGADVITSACFDSKHNLRKQLIKDETASEYKSGRHSILGESDFEDIEKMKIILDEAGVNVFCEDGCEADDIIAYLANSNSPYDLTVIYSSDKDMIANVGGTVGMRRFNNGMWVNIGDSNYSEVVSSAFKTNIPNNAIGLYLCTVGDSADHIKGINKFGGRAFEKLVSQIGSEFDWTSLKDYDNVRLLLIDCMKRAILTEEQFRQAVNAYNMVRPIEITNDSLYSNGSVAEDEYGFKKIIKSIDEPSVMKVETVESRVAAYTKAGMPSLAK